MDQETQALAPKLLNIEDLATLLQVPRSWIYEHTRTSKTSGFPVIRVGKYLRFEYQKVLDFLKQN